MDWRDGVLAEVGKSMGVDDLGFGDSGVVSFEFEQMGALYMEQQEEGVLMYLVKNLSQHDCLGILVSALKQCHYTKLSSFPLQVGLKDEDELFLFIYLENEAFTRPNIEGSIDVLARQFERIGVM